MRGLDLTFIYHNFNPSSRIVGTDGNAKLIDFGLARDFAPPSLGTKICARAYAAPEQYEHRQRALVQLLGLRVAALVVVDQGEVDEALRDIRMVRRQRLLSDGERALAKGVAVGEALLFEKYQTLRVNFAFIGAILLAAVLIGFRPTLLVRVGKRLLQLSSRGCLRQPR